MLFVGGCGMSQATKATEALKPFGWSENYGVLVSKAGGVRRRWAAFQAKMAADRERDQTTVAGGGRGGAGGGAAAAEEPTSTPAQQVAKKSPTPHVNSQSCDGGLCAWKRG